MASAKCPLPITEKISKPLSNDLHYQQEGYQMLAQQVARSIEAVLPATQPEAR